MAMKAQQMGGVGKSKPREHYRKGKQGPRHSIAPCGSPCLEFHQTDRYRAGGTSGKGGKGRVRKRGWREMVKGTVRGYVQCWISLRRGSPTG